MEKPIIKLTIPGKDHHLDIYENDSGKLVFDMCPNDDDDGYSGGIVEIESDVFSELLHKLLSK